MEGSWLSRHGPRIAVSGFLRPRASHSALFQLSPIAFPRASTVPTAPTGAGAVSTHQGDEHPGSLAEPKVAPPSPEVGRQVAHHLLQAHSPSSGRQFPDSLLEPDHGLRRDAPFRLPVPGEAEAQKLPFLRSSHRAFLPVHLELELVVRKRVTLLHHPLPRLHAAHVDVAVVRIAHEAMAAPLQLPVQFVQHEVR